MNTEHTETRIIAPDSAILPAISREIAGGRAVVHHEDTTISSIAALADTPYRSAGAVRLATPAEFSRFVGLRAAEKPYIFVGSDGIDAVFNYRTEDGSQGWGDDFATLPTEYSLDWKEWRKKDGYYMSQTEFCDFVEDHQPNIVDPNGADLLNLISNFRQLTHVSYGSAYRTQDGQVQLEYKEEKRGVTETLSLPSQFTLHLPVIDKAEEITTYKVKARLYWRVDKDSAKLKFMYSLIRPDIPERNAREDLSKWSKENMPYAEVFIGCVSKTPACVLNVNP